MIGTVSILPFEVVGGSGLQWGSSTIWLNRSRRVRSSGAMDGPVAGRRQGNRRHDDRKSEDGWRHSRAGWDGDHGRDGGHRRGPTSRGRHRSPRGRFQKTCPLDNEVCLQDGLLREIARVLDPQTSLAAQSAPIAKQALPYYAQGLEYLRRDSVSYDTAIKFFQQAIALIRRPSSHGWRSRMRLCFDFRTRATRQCSARPGQFSKML